MAAYRPIRLKAATKASEGRLNASGTLAAEKLAAAFKAALAELGRNN